MPFPQVVASLRHRNFRHYFIGQALSMGGTWVQSTALSYLVWRTTHSPFLLGLITFLGQIPNLFFSPMAGVLADRYNRRRLVVFTQCLAMGQALGLAAAVGLGFTDYYVLAFFALLLGSIISFDLPARHSLIFELVSRDDLPNAVALGSLLFNGAQFIAPPIAGFFLLYFREWVFFLVNGLSYSLVITILATMKLRPRPIPVHTGSALRNITEAVGFVGGHAAIRDYLLMIATISLFGIPVVVLLPAVAGEALGWDDPRGFSLLMGASGMGAVLGGLFMARGAAPTRSPRLIPATGLAFAVFLFTFTWMDSLAACFALLLPTAFCMIMQIVGVNAFIQGLVPDRYRGRVMSFYSMSFLGLLPLGSLMMGLLADQIGTMRAIRIGSILCFIGAAVLLTRLPRTRASIADLRVLSAAEASASYSVQEATQS